MPKLLWKGNPHPDSPLSGVLLLSLQWHTRRDCASLSTRHTTFSTQSYRPRNSICLPLFACSFHLHEGNEPWPEAWRNDTLHVANQKPGDSRHSPFFRFLTSKLYINILNFTWPPVKSFLRAWYVWKLHCLCKSWPQTAAAAAVDFESRRCEKTVCSSCTWQEAQVASIPRPAASKLINISPRFPFLLHLVPVWGLCTSVRTASSHSEFQQDVPGLSAPGTQGTCYASLPTDSMFI